MRVGWGAVGMGGQSSPEGGIWAAGAPKRVAFPRILFIYLSSCAASSMLLALVSLVSGVGAPLWLR